MSNKTTGFSEDCCWTDVRQNCRDAKTCTCVCHTLYPDPPPPCSDYLRILTREVGSLRLARQSEDRAIAAEARASQQAQQIAALTEALADVRRIRSFKKDGYTVLELIQAVDALLAAAAAAEPPRGESDVADHPWAMWLEPTMSVYSRCCDLPQSAHASVSWRMFTGDQQPPLGVEGE